ncbi:MAG: cyclic nucleotide-binding domain-containing protein [Alphaproteobacteria bacterium]|nr:cyclic nucleotide-binding domain-containing protein [Alphaproteobacteria bacterium]
MEQGRPSGMTGLAPFARKKFAANKALFNEGAAGDAAYMIMKGKVEIRKGMRTSNPRVVTTLESGDICGEMALFDDRPRMATAVTVGECELVVIPREEFTKRLGDMNPVMRHILVIMVARVRSMTDELLKRKTETRWHDIFVNDGTGASGATAEKKGKETKSDAAAGDQASPPGPDDDDPPTPP